MAELGFLGVVVYTLTHTPLRCGHESNAGDLLLYLYDRHIDDNAGKALFTAVAAVVKNGYEEEYGARPLRRYIQKNIEDELAEMALKGQLQGIKGIKVDAADDVVSILRL